MASQPHRSATVLVMVLVVLGVAWTGASAAPSTSTEQLRPAAANLSVALPGRQAQLMAPECQLERAPMQCEKSSGQKRLCACRQATLTGHTEVLSLVLPGDDTTWPPKQWEGLAAK